MYCYKCGEDNPDEAKFCKNCGATLKKEEGIWMASPLFQTKPQIIKTTTSKKQPLPHQAVQAAIHQCGLDAAA